MRRLLLCTLLISVPLLAPAAECVVLLHGLGSAGPVWWGIGEGLAARHIAAFAPDLRGHGRSAHPGSYGIPAYAADVLTSCRGPWDLYFRGDRCGNRPGQLFV